MSGNSCASALQTVPIVIDFCLGPPAPSLRSRNPERRKEAVEALENLAAVASHLKHLLLVRDLRKIVR